MRNDLLVSFLFYILAACFCAFFFITGDSVTVKGIFNFELLSVFVSTLLFLGLSDFSGGKEPVNKSATFAFFLILFLVSMVFVALGYGIIALIPLIYFWASIASRLFSEYRSAYEHIRVVKIGVNEEKRIASYFSRVTVKLLSKYLLLGACMILVGLILVPLVLGSKENPDYSNLLYGFSIIFYFVILAFFELRHFLRLKPNQAKLGFFRKK